MHPELEQAWVREMHARAVVVSPKMIKEIGVRILDRVNEMIQDEKKIHFTFSNGWLFKFQRRRGLRSWKSRGESGFGNEEAISQELTLLEIHLRICWLKVVSNADTFDHFSRISADRTIAKSQLEGKKIFKNRLSYFA